MAQQSAKGLNIAAIMGCKINCLYIWDRHCCLMWLLLVTNKHTIVCHSSICILDPTPRPLYTIAFLQLQIASSRRKRLSNDTLADFTANFCDPRFVQLDPADGSRYVLIWDCPPGEPSPPQDIQTNICEVVVEAGVVASCRANNMTLLTPATPPASLPRIR